MNIGYRDYGVGDIYFTKAVFIDIGLMDLIMINNDGWLELLPKDYKKF